MINAKIMIKEFPQNIEIINNYVVLAYTLKQLTYQLPDEKAEKLRKISDEVMVSINSYSYIKTDNFYYNTPIWIKEKGKYVSKKVGDKDLYIRAGTLRKLINVDRDLRKEGYELVVLVAYRSYELQEHLREHYAYVSGNHGTNAGLDVVAKAGKSNHQKGTAVDVKIRRLDGEPVEMPTEYLDFSKNSSIANHKDNEIVKIMQRIFKANGFKPYEREWWHFDDIDTSKYKPVKM